MSELRTRPRVNASVEEALEAGACVGEDLTLAPNALPPPWALLVDEALEVGEEDERRGPRGVWMPWEVIL